MKEDNISFIIPAYNCEETIEETVDSIFNGNLTPGDEVIIVNDHSSDNTDKIIKKIVEKYKKESIRIFHHKYNKGGASARNTAVENSKNNLIFCLDSDNILEPNSVPKLKNYLIDNCADVAAFQELNYFLGNSTNVTHKWVYNDEINFMDCFCGGIVPGASGNYLYTKKSWEKAGGYPEFAGALDTWGFGVRQLATGSRMISLPNSHYFHRYGLNSYWVRESKKGNISLTALQIIIPYFYMFYPKDIDYIMSKKYRNKWFENLTRRSLRNKIKKEGNNGHMIKFK
jgi:glycosyltransferase involved in cell wall biosynthesis